MIYNISLITKNNFLSTYSAASLKSTDDLGLGMVREGTKCGTDKVLYIKYLNP